MPKILLYSTLSFWFLTILQASVVPFWLVDLNYVAIIIWGLYYVKNRQWHNYPIWGYWIPVIFGLGMASFLFYSYWAVLPYIIGTTMISFLIARRNQWLFRFKEGLISITALFVAYLLVTVLIRSQVMQYVVTVDFFTRTFISFVLALVFWVYFLKQAERLKIR